MVVKDSWWMKSADLITKECPDMLNYWSKTLTQKENWSSLVGLGFSLKNKTQVSKLIEHIDQSTHVCVPGKRYNLADVSAALCMSLGLIWFTLADSKVAPNFNVTGILFNHSWHTLVETQTFWWFSAVFMCGL